ncbi:unnamed protein product [Candidula unifasciata]|uniref:Uncharacterized protein n=1 Tax=Candidula unifasciata TaxID=100452 RepID=A0A8S3ZG61_9EUPU|nr:unnamed protein product [Candidula unifasciata]
MAFHHEWAWYNINYPNPDGAVCRLKMDDKEWKRITRWRDLDWFKNGGLESGTILFNNRNCVRPPPDANSGTPHLLPAAGIPSASHARRHPWFYYELYQRMLEEREDLARCGLLPPDQVCHVSPCAGPKQNRARKIMTAAQRHDQEVDQCLNAVHEMERDGWFDTVDSRYC